jgi:uncharacterized spore protein YtfJ
MPEKLSDQLFTVPVESWDKGVALMNRLYEVAEQGAVFSEPSEHHGHTIITASEVSVGLGFGHGFGGGGGGAPGEGAGAAARDIVGGGGGGGGGGATSNRPVAVISISAAGVHVEPIIDVTKIAIAAATALGAMGVLLNRMKKLAG